MSQINNPSPQYTINNLLFDIPYNLLIFNLIKKKTITTLLINSTHEKNISIFNYNTYHYDSRTKYDGTNSYGKNGR